jgi:hypothetical protein
MLLQDLVHFGQRGVEPVALAMQPSVTFNGNTNWIRFVGRPYNGQHNEVNQRDVSSNYFKTRDSRHTDLPLLGHSFSDREVLKMMCDSR